MQFSLESRTASLSVGEFADFSPGPHETGGGAQGLWRAQLGQHWHNELRARTQATEASARFEIPLEGRLVYRGWTIALAGRIDQWIGPTLREIKTVTRPLPIEEQVLRADYPAYFLQLATYLVLLRQPPAPLIPPVPVAEWREVTAPPPGSAPSDSSAPPPPSVSPSAAKLTGELVFVETGTGLSQTIALTPFDEAVVFHQLDALVEFLQAQLRAAHRRHALVFRSPFTTLRPGQETIQHDLAATFGWQPRSLGLAPSSTNSQPSALGPQASTSAPPPSTILLFEAPTGYGKTGCVLEFALGRLKSGQFDRLIWLTGKSTGQLQVVHTLRTMTTPAQKNPIGSLSAAAPSALPATKNLLGSLSPPPQSNLIGYKSPEAPGDSPITSNLLGYSPAPPAPAGAGPGLAVWQVRNKREHCINDVFHCVRDACGYLAGGAERWPGSGLNRFCTGDTRAHDLDTLKAAGREARICPYEITRAALCFHDVWIGDYNYVFAPDNRGLFADQPGFDPARTLLVIDEAHNLPSRVADAYSHAALETDARGLLAELDHLGAPAALVLAVEEWVRLLATLRPCDSLDPTTDAELRDLLGRLAELVAVTPLDYAALGPRHCESIWQFPALQEFLADTTLRSLLWVPRAGELAFTCIDATEAIGTTLEQFGGAILMSATLRPFDRTAEACGLIGPGQPTASAGAAAPSLPHPAGYTLLSAPAPWREQAYDVAVDLRVDTSFRQRAGHYATTAATIEALHAAAGRQQSALSGQPSAGSPQSSAPGSPLRAPPPLAVFFPSYAYAESVLRALERSGSTLRVAVQPRQADLAAQTAWVEENLALADALFLVLGSSFAEGIDLLGGRVTHAMVVGPALPEVNAVQQARLDALSALGRDAAFRRVYQIPGLQKVNQALGRLVRAPGQRAKVLLHCRRFAETSYATLLAPEYQFYREIADPATLRAWLT